MSCLSVFKSQQHDRELMKLLRFDLHGIYINPAHADPTVVSSLSPFNKTTVTQSLNGSRHICVIFGFLDDSTHLLTPRVNSNGKGTKEIHIIPIVAEWERSMSFYGTVLDHLELTMFSNDSGSVTFGTRYGEVNQGHTGEYPFKIYMDICNMTLSHSQHK